MRGEGFVIADNAFLSALDTETWAAIHFKKGRYEYIVEIPFRCSRLCRRVNTNTLTMTSIRSLRLPSWVSQVLRVKFLLLSTMFSLIFLF